MQVCNAVHMGAVWERLIVYRGVGSCTVSLQPEMLLRPLSRGPFRHSCSHLLRDSNRWATVAYRSNFQVLVKYQLSAAFMMEQSKSQHSIGFSVHGATQQMTISRHST